MKSATILIAALLATGCAGTSQSVAETPEYCLRDGSTFDSNRCARYLAWKTTASHDTFPDRVTMSSESTP